MTGLDTIRDLLIDGIIWRSQFIAKDVELINFNKASSQELNDLVNTLNEALMKIHRLYG